MSQKPFLPEICVGGNPLRISHATEPHAGTRPQPLSWLARISWPASKFCQICSPPSTKGPSPLLPKAPSDLFSFRIDNILTVAEKPLHLATLLQPQWPPGCPSNPPALPCLLCLGCCLLSFTSVTHASPCQQGLPGPLCVKQPSLPTWAFPIVVITL